MTRLDDVGRVGAQTAMALLDGAEPATLQVPAVMPAPLQVDWRQIERWGIPAKAVPAGTKIWFREPTIWESHRGLVILGVAVILLQTGLIVALLIMRRSRRFTVAALARNEQHMRLAAQAAGLSTWVLDSDATGQRDEGAIERASTSGVARYLPSDFRETLARIAPEDRPAVDAALRRALETNGEFDVQYRIDGAEGECRWESAKGRADPAQSSRLVGVAIDITQRKRAEVQTELDRAALYHMGRVSLLGQLSASIAHQLSQPLTSILSNAEAAQKMLERDPVDLPELGQIFADIVADDHRAVAVIRRLGALFRRGESQFEPLDLNELVRDSLDIFRATITTRRLTITTDSAADLPLVSGDRVQLQQLLLNLIVNAADAMTDSPEGARDATISTEVRGNSVKLCVADKGPGVPADALDKVFEPFWSTRAGGMGMGLAVCRSIAVAHGGSLTATNAPTGGAVFCASLPALVAP
jgi:C4-dicarboxylate-specific signal transduction histidine kinase